MYTLCYNNIKKKRGGKFMASIVNVRVDENTKREVEVLFDKLGMNISVAVNMFFKQALMEEALPFQPKITHKKHIALKERLKEFNPVSQEFPLL
jgi:DNA-damage-inducible protein J